MKRILTIGCIATSVILSSCIKEKDKENEVLPTYDYSKLDTTTYSPNFKNTAGDTTTDRTVGRNYSKLHADLRTKLGSATSSVISSTDVINLYNTSGLNLKSVTASSLPSNQASIQTDIEKFLSNHAKVSVYYADSAKNKKAGIAYFKSLTSGSTSKYLVDTNGIEWTQVAQKALIGAYQLDYICNILLADTEADNTNLLAGSKQTQLAQNWDRAYAILTTNEVYGSKYKAATGTTSESSGESQLGAYAWEYNPNPNYTKKPKNLYDLNKDFLIARKAVENKDKLTVKAQAEKIRLIFEKTMAKAALGYLSKWKTLTTDAEKMHALGEGLGFIYSLRFCKLSGCDATFADNIFKDLLNTGHWDMNKKSNQILGAEDAIKAKFGL